MRWRTDGATKAAEHDGMKPIRSLFPTTLYARWKNAAWPILTGRPHPSSEIPEPAQVAPAAAPKTPL